MRESAEPARSALAGCDLGEAVERLSWIRPGAAALTALCRSASPDSWSHLRFDPGAILLILRQSGANLAERLDSPALLDEALSRLDSEDPQQVDWDAPALRSILQAGHACASIAEALSRKVGRVDPKSAWIAGLLAPLGWYVACTLDSGAAAACLANPGLAANPLETQRRHWGIDAAALSRRVGRRWNLPAWLTAIVGHLSLSAETALELGADADLFRLTRLAVGIVQVRGFPFGYSDAERGADLAALGLFEEDVKKLDVPAAPLDQPWQDARRVPLLRDLLTVAAENRRLREGSLRRRTEAEADRMHDALERQSAVAAESLRASKLSALAEFAAGAGHEINNPLAVISGQAQYVLGHAAQWFTVEASDGPRKSLQTIIAQTKRIHSLLRDLMQFARPSAPRPAWFDLTELLPETAASLRDLAEQRHVRLEVHTGPGKLRVLGDREQIKAALSNILRNGVEATPAEGRVRLTLREPADNRVDVIVEDSGHGPDETQREHLFDPFYSGRSAGRGRGLGLSTAWRLARLQGGDVRFDPPGAGGPTRFVLELPWSNVPEPVAAPAASIPVFTETAGLHGTALTGYPRD